MTPDELHTADSQARRSPQPSRGDPSSTSESHSTTDSPPETEASGSAPEASGSESARSGITPDGSADASGGDTAGGDTASRADTSASDDAAPSDPTDATVDQLRRELNEQFESIRIVSPGQYELNLMELYDREEYIISLREDGRYVIEVPDSWSGD